ncbi:MAG: DUF4214 domain-containing protein [Saccharofermentans sp.]|nr:DUF4214 domain-containing protein [Saccharofermentans sp.]
MRKTSSKISIFLLVACMVVSMFSSVIFAAGDATTTVDISSFSADITFDYAADIEEVVPQAVAQTGKTDSQIRQALTPTLAANGYVPVTTSGTITYDASGKAFTFKGEGALPVTIAGIPATVVIEKTLTLPVENISAVLNIDGQDYTAEYNKSTGSLTCSYVLPENRSDVSITIKDFTADTTYNSKPGQVIYDTTGEDSIAKFDVEGVNKLTLVNPKLSNIKASTVTNGTPMDVTSVAEFDGTGIKITYKTINVCSKVDITVPNPVGGSYFQTKATVAGNGVITTADIVWNATGIADYETVYTATIYVNSDKANNWLFDDNTVFTVNGTTVDSLHLNGTYDEHVITYTAPKTGANENGIESFVERLYLYTLDRHSDPQGLKDWMDRIYYEGYTGAEVAKGFLFSAEFLNKDISNEDFVEILYKVFFNRASDAQGKQTWLNELANGASKQDVIMGFINAPEWANTCLVYGVPSGSIAGATITVEPNDYIKDFVIRLYDKCLNRYPDPTGYKTWTTMLANRQLTGTSCSAGVVFSEEFTNKGLSNADYVKILYAAMLGRQPDPHMQDWITLLDNQTMTREEVFYGFSYSAEFSKICADYKIVK